MSVPNKLNAQTLLQGNNLICFAFGAARAGLPSVLGGLTSVLGTSLNLLDTKLGGIVSTAPYRSVITY
jgi:hypothetical protein